MDNEKIVETVTAEVLRQLSIISGNMPAHPGGSLYKALAIFTGGTIGFEAGLLQLTHIQSLNTGLTVVLSAAAEKILDTDRIRQALGSNTSVLTSTSPYPGPALRAADIVLIPVLTQNSAAKLANTLADSMVLTLILQALMLGKPVIAATNAADPDDNRRGEKNMSNLLPALREALQANLKKIATYGIKLTPVENLAAAAQQALAKEIKPYAQDKLAKKRVLHAESVKGAVNSGTKTIVITQGTIVTPLARDIARALKVEIVVK
ncbi:flavoprotein [Sporomusa sp.]|uniref:flavoprotein n=1 Tax=Sporomusa sp. TaxID=2078658 RepID=UPI002C4C4EA9|nr:flavoprotein [Sporomusa sp.]HWR08877.1 flavoprotein [Sporomusa sp.]